MSGRRRKWGERLNREKRGAVNVSKDGDCADKGGEGLVKEAEWQKARRKKKKGKRENLWTKMNCSVIGRINVGNVLFCKPRIC